jgi:hypothetical protein
MRVTGSVCLAACLMFAALATRGAVAPPCAVPQSPRNVNAKAYPSPYNGTSRDSMVVSVSPSQDSVQFRPRPGAPVQKLVRCGQHYHAPVETVQGCAGETEVITPPGKTSGPGQWIEVHTVYAPNATPHCENPESLDCCLGQPVLVRGFSAKVVAGAADGPILTPGGRPLAEWSGSNTGPDKDPGDCKPVAAAWSFRLACNAPGITQAQLNKQLPRGAQGARPLQAGPRVSKDLTLVK